MKIKVKQFFGRHKLILASFAFPALIMVLSNSTQKDRMMLHGSR